MHHIGLTREEIGHLQRLIARLDAQPPDPNADRRENPRIDFSQPMWVNLPGHARQPWVHVYSRNLSTGGLSFLSRSLFYANQHLVVSHELNEGSSLLVLCKVCFCRTIDLGIQEVGLAFVTALPDPGQRREIPGSWLSLVLQSDWLSRRRFPAELAQ